MYKGLRIISACLLTAVTLAVTAAVFDIGGWGRLAGDWLMRMQLVEAVLTASVGWLVMWTVVTLLFGRLYCSVACPLGALQDLVGIAARRVRGKKRNFRYSRPRNTLRVLVVVVLVEVLCLGITALVGWLDPYSNYVRVLQAFTLNTAAAWAAGLTVLAVVTAMSWRGGRLLCNTLCPVGAVLGGATKLSALRFDINPDLCIHCGECERVCKSQCVDQKRSLVDNSRCVTCFDCAAACPNGAITWRVGRHRLQWPLLQSIQTAAPSAMNAPTARPMQTAAPSSQQTDKITDTDETIS